MRDGIVWTAKKKEGLRKLYQRNNKQHPIDLLMVSHLQRGAFHIKEALSEPIFVKESGILVANPR